jgi:hypothetical protein
MDQNLIYLAVLSVLALMGVTLTVATAAPWL